MGPLHNRDEVNLIDDNLTVNFSPFKEEIRLGRQRGGDCDSGEDAWTTARWRLRQRRGCLDEGEVETATAARILGWRRLACDFEADKRGHEDWREAVVLTTLG
nr:hypothetical protein Itr_chr09CG12030 [Ipomoea trifida]